VAVDYNIIRIILQDIIRESAQETSGQHTGSFPTNGYTDFCRKNMCIRQRQQSDSLYQNNLQLPNRFERGFYGLFGQRVSLRSYLQHAWNRGLVRHTPSWKVETRGASQLQILSTKGSKSRCKVALTISALVQKLRPFVIFRMQRTLRIFVPTSDLMFVSSIRHGWISLASGVGLVN
jgi:hypothetical protein